MDDKNKEIVPSKKPFKVIHKKPSTEVRIAEDEEEAEAKYNMEEKGPNVVSDKPKKKRRWWLWIIGIIILGILSYFGYQAYAVAKRIITANNSGGSPFLRFMDKVDPKKLQGEGDGRINILLLGIGGAGHDGADLTDTMMVVSVDPVNKTVSMLSIPRDLWVDIPGGGESKINAVNSFGNQNKKRFADGPTASKQVVSQILDLPIHYYALMDFEGFRKMVDEVGGVDVNVEKSIVDPYYPDDRPGHNGQITYKVSAGQQHMDGTAALRYARSRETTSDFDRAHRQQVILKALKEKALSAGIMANPAKLSVLMNLVGDHFRTDMQLWEMERFLSILRDVNTQEIAHRVLDDTPEGLLKSSNVNGAYVLLPRSGNYKEIQALAHSIFMEPYILKEKARIEIRYPSKKTAIAKQAEDRLKEFGYNVVSVVPSQPGDDSDTAIIDFSKGSKPYTIELLKNRFKDAKMHSDNNASRTDVDIVIVLGDNFKEI
ncbi:MAG: LCP family protein [Candidatus Berkelbacteria bacterium]|nr:LCP family protein [Candidatus Berkelbacteria bacterium]